MTIICDFENIQEMGRAVTESANAIEKRKFTLRPWNRFASERSGPATGSGWLKVNELINANSSAKLFPPDTILIALYRQGQTRGRSGRLQIEAATNQACCVILPTEKL